MATVITIEPLDFGADKTLHFMNEWCSSLATTGGNTPYRLDYPATLDINSIPAGVEALDEAVKTIAGVKIVLAHSQGASVATEWLAAHAGDVDAPASSQLSFVITGNPQRNPGRIPDRRSPNGALMIATPTGSQYTVKDIARRWDGWCNYDNYPDVPNPWASIRLFIGQWIDHCNYNAVSLTNPSNITRSVVGNTTFLIAP